MSNLQLHQGMKRRTNQLFRRLSNKRNTRVHWRMTTLNLVMKWRRALLRLEEALRASPTSSSTWKKTTTNIKSPIGTDSPPKMATLKVTLALLRSTKP